VTAATRAPCGCPDRSHSSFRAPPSALPTTATDFVRRGGKC